ncbi:MAG: ABC transporter substrate-binding protein [Phycisphaerales bacterium]|nr:ABC transporter substrate-binding protein [Phycisphaerales bacterium]
MRLWLPVLLILAPLAITSVSCERSAPEPSTDAPRIVALSPAIARMLADLGLEDHIVGRHQWDMVLPADVPKVGDQTEIDYELLIELEPTDVLLQYGERPIPARLRTLAAEYGWHIRSFDIDTIDDVQAVVKVLPQYLSFPDTQAGRAHGEQTAARADALAEALVDHLQPRDAVRQAGRILLLFAVDPPTAFGPETFLAQVVTRLGGANAQTVGDYPQLSLEDVINLDPDTIVIVRSADESTPIELLAGPVGRLNIRAVRSGRITALRHPLALLPSTSLLEVADELEARLAELHEADEVAP